MKSRRFIFVVVLAALLAGALAAGNASSTPAPTPSTAPATSSPAVLAQSDGVWFCPGLPRSLPHAGGRVTFSNIGAASADVVVTDLLDSGKTSHLTFAVASNSVVTKTRDSLGGAGALTVETFGSRVLVEEGIEGAATVGLDSADCATETSEHWYFGAGTTPRGVQQFLVIDNPYASDAKVDVTLRTGTGVRRPDALQGLDGARRSREVIAVHDLAVRQDRVAVEVDVEIGSVVAGQALVYTSAAGTPGVALSLGSPAAASEWTFAGGTNRPGSTSVVAIANVGTDDAQVDVQATAESSKDVLAPVSLTVAQDDVAWVRLGNCPSSSPTPCVNIPEGLRYALDVRSEQNVSIVAQALTRFDDASDSVGTVTSAGAVGPSRSWAFARSLVAGERATTVSLFNPAAEPSVVDVALVHDGQVERPRSLQHVSIPPGRQVTLLVVGGRKPSAHDAALTITATQAIYAERLIVATGEATRSVGIAGP